jgi:hypothetical protein
MFNEIYGKITTSSLPVARSVRQARDAVQTLWFAQDAQDGQDGQDRARSGSAHVDSAADGNRTDRVVHRLRDAAAPAVSTDDVTAFARAGRRLSSDPGAVLLTAPAAYPQTVVCRVL